jgi:membrane-bound ClpP family serine protease
VTFAGSVAKPSRALVSGSSIVEVLAIGLVLMVVAVALVVAEAHLSTGGLVAGAAVVALVVGVTLLAIGAGAGLIPALAVTAAVLGASVSGLLALWRGLRSVRSRRPRSGTEAMVGHVGVIRVGASAARVFIDGGLWRAQPSPLDEGTALHDGDRVVVERVNGLTLGVRKAEEWELNP